MQLHLRVAHQEAQQLDAGVTRTAHYPYLDHGTSPPLPYPEKQKAAWAGGFSVSDGDDQRLENCFRLRALCRPTFFRSTSRASRVTSPAFLSTGLSSAS